MDFRVTRVRTWRGARRRHRRRHRHRRRRPPPAPPPPYPPPLPRLYPTRISLFSLVAMREQLLPFAPSFLSTPFRFSLSLSLSLSLNLHLSISLCENFPKRVKFTLRSLYTPPCSYCCCSALLAVFLISFFSFFSLCHCVYFYVDLEIEKLFVKCFRPDI
jgi:hypothetical protein